MSIPRSQRSEVRLPAHSFVRLALNRGDFAEIETLLAKLGVAAPETEPPIDVLERLERHHTAEAERAVGFERAVRELAAAVCFGLGSMLQYLELKKR